MRATSLRVAAPETVFELPQHCFTLNTPIDCNQQRIGGAPRYIPAHQTKPWPTPDTHIRTKPCIRAFHHGQRQVCAMPCIFCRGNDVAKKRQAGHNTKAQSVTALETHDVATPEYLHFVRTKKKAALWRLVSISLAMIMFLYWKRYRGTSFFFRLLREPFVLIEFR